MNSIYLGKKIQASWGELLISLKPQLTHPKSGVRTVPISGIKENNGLFSLFLAALHGWWELACLSRDEIQSYSSSDNQVLTTGPPGNSQIMGINKLKSVNYLTQGLEHSWQYILATSIFSLLPFYIQRILTFHRSDIPKLPSKTRSSNTESLPAGEIECWLLKVLVTIIFI